MIRVAFDLSFLGRWGDASAPTTGVGRVIMELARELRRREDVELVAVGLHGHDAFPMLTGLRTEAYVRNLHGCEFPAFRAFQSRTGLDRIYGSRLLTAGTEVFSPARNPISRRRRLENRLLLKLSRLDCRVGLPSGRFDVFHATFDSVPSRRSVGNIGRVQMIYDAIPILFPEDVGPHVRGWFTKVLQNLDRERDFVIAISQATKRDFCAAADFDPERVFVAHLAAGAEFQPCEDAGVRAQVRARYGIPDEEFILTVANPQPRKNLPFLVRVFFELASRNPLWRGNLVVAGNALCGWGMEEVDAAVAKRPEFRDRVIVTGAIREGELPTLYSACAVFAFPSLYEGFGLPPLEAMACGAPVVCSGSSSLPEVVGNAAVLASPASESEFVTAIESLLKDPAKRFHFSQLGRARAREFTWRSTANRVAEAYARAVRCQPS